MAYCLGYYGASDKVNHDLNYDGAPPKVTDDQRKAIEEAVAAVIPEIKNLDKRDRRAVVRWVINEGY